ncbi:branched-chain amino acid transport system substrate-binding protein [Ochrobactrum daejeonense]|uniref:Branched-chain amino acid transport system substrate-binding protein n=1 Tax=Brucella daejeonensis TaxID=659015 RepID=A0A7W9AX59_9HYPH|nr:ABC transporter substrate-binding protein [Brucella daejeonensis]MBB5702228.1 branched-chain amino acid transport system substrate-binding protein [Brucella daejeonensis]
MSQKLTRRIVLGVLAAGTALVTFPAMAQEPVTIGLITTLSTPAGYIGEDIRDAFNLAIKEDGGKLGGVPVTLKVEDDALKPVNGKQVADKMLGEGIELYTGIIFSNVLAAALPSVMNGNAFYVSNNAGPSTFAGEKCNPNYFVASYQNDAFHEAAGLSANELGFKKVVILAPNYQAGRDALEGFKRTYKGEVAGEIYTKLDQTDFSVELARIKSMAPDAIYQFHPGGAGINFAKQYANSGMAGSIPMIIPSFSMDARMISATGNAADGVYASALWTTETDNPASKAFVAAFRKDYGRDPTMYAAQAYDTAHLIGTGLKAVNGDLSKQDDFRNALRKADFTAIRGAFKMGQNQHPVQDYYLTKFEKDADGKIVQNIVKKVATDYTDAYASKCTMK